MRRQFPLLDISQTDPIRVLKQHAVLFLSHLLIAAAVTRTWPLTCFWHQDSLSSLLQNRGFIYLFIFLRPGWQQPIPTAVLASDLAWGEMFERFQRCDVVIPPPQLLWAGLDKDAKSLKSWPAKGCCFALPQRVEVVRTEGFQKEMLPPCGIIGYPIHLVKKNLSIQNLSYIPWILLKSDIK